VLRLWGVDTLVICGTVANICVHYTAASAALRWYDAVIPRDAISALDPFDLESSLRQTVFLFAGRVTTVAGVRATRDCPMRCRAGGAHAVGAEATQIEREF
jgi:nicotinamidase-related amidase